MKGYDVVAIAMIYLALLTISVLAIWGASPIPSDAGQFAKLLTVAAAVPSGLMTVLVTLYVSYSTAKVVKQNKYREDNFEILTEAHGALMSYFRALDDLQVGRLDLDQVDRAKKRVKEAEEKLVIYAPAVVSRYFYKVWQECTYVAEKAERLESGGQKKKLWTKEKKGLAKMLKKFREGYTQRIEESERAM